MKQAKVYANPNPAVDRFGQLDEDSQTAFRDALKSYLRAYAFLAQVMAWTDRDLESLYLYRRALQPKLPTAPGDPLPQISDSVLLTRLRTEAQGEGADLSLEARTDEPGVALPGGGTGKAYDSPMGRLSELIANLNERFGMNLTEADQIYFVQQKQAIKQDADLRVVALNNDREQYRIVMEKKADDLIIERHEANGQLFEAMFDKPGVREQFMKYLASSYDEIRNEDAG